MEMASIGFLFGALMAMIFFGIGVCIGDIRHNFSNNDTSERKRLCNSGTDTVLCKRCKYRGGDNGCDKQMEV